MFKKAVKTESKLRLAISGASGSGKTFTALSVATNLGSKVAVIDTEFGSASKYADLFEFDVLNLSAPFNPMRFVEAIKAAGEAGYDVVIVDSVSHAWNGSGGILEIVENASKKYKGNSYAGWKDATPVQNALIDAIVTAQTHIVVTMRSKQAYVLSEGRNGRTAPQKVGMAPIQRDGFEYEFDVFIEMDMDNNGIVSKTRCSELQGAVIAKPSKQLADTLKKWLSGAPAREVHRYGDGSAVDMYNEAAVKAFEKYQAGNDGKAPADVGAMRLWFKNANKPAPAPEAPPVGEQPQVKEDSAETITPETAMRKRSLAGFANEAAVLAGKNTNEVVNFLVASFKDSDSWPYDAKNNEKYLNAVMDGMLQPA